MTQTDSLLANVMTALDTVSAPQMGDAAFAVLSKPLDLKYLWIYVADYSEETLEPFPNIRSPSPPAQSVSIVGSVAGRAYQKGSIEEESRNGDTTIWIPLFQRSESIGVLALGTNNGPALEPLALALGLIVASALLGTRRHSDVFEVARGAKQLRLAAAMQWDLLPIHSYSDPWVQIAGRLEPAYDIGGDAFDFAVNTDFLELGVFDAMGRGLNSTVLSSLAIGSYRFARRRRATLGEVVVEIDAAVASVGEGEQFVTGHICQLDLTMGRLKWINAGHPLPILMRKGDSTLFSPATPVVPFGLRNHPEATEDRIDPIEIELEPDDILLFYSDGLVEARGKGGGIEFGLQMLIDLVTRNWSPRATLSATVRLVLDAVKHHSEMDMRDDATLLAVRWLGPKEVESPPPPE